MSFLDDRELCFVTGKGGVGHARLRRHASAPVTIAAARGGAPPPAVDGRA